MTSYAQPAAVFEPATVRRQLARAERTRRLAAIGLIAPLVLFLAFTFVAPIFEMLRRSVEDTDLAQTWPHVVEAIRGWDGQGLPGDAVFAALATDMRASYEAGTLAVAARRLNYPIAGGRSLVMNTGRKLARLEAQPASWRKALIAADPAWGDRAVWTAVARASGPLTDFFLLSALDMRKDVDGNLILAPSGQVIYLTVLGRTLWISALVTAICLLLGFPLAYLLANASERTGSVLMILLLLPFWTSLLARIAAWVVLLQENGIINQALLGLGMIDHPLRLIFNRTGVIVAMVHVLLPFMILPIYGVMKGIRPEYVRAARSLGATPTTAFVRVYLPQTRPGIAAGVLLVFIMSIGYYITPALLGGADDQMISWFIAFYTTDTVNWGLAAALGVVLLVATGILYVVYQRLTGARGLSLS
jgi:putative spermidine/putrescine transport system permease protein